MIDAFRFFFEDIFLFLKEKWVLKKVIVLRAIISFILAMFFLIAVFNLNFYLKDLVLVGEDNKEIAITLPYSSISDPEKNFIIKGTINKNFFTPNWVNIIPDDGVLEIKVNGETLSLDIPDKSRLYNWDIGFDYPLGKYLKDGANTVEIKIVNRGGPFGLKLRISLKDNKYLTFLICFFVFTFIFLFELLCLFRIKKRIIIVIILCILSRLFYFIITDWDVRGHDTRAHIEYIEYLITNFKLPESGSMWESHQPPLYYVIAVLIYKILELFGLNKIFIYKGIQFFSIFLDIGIVFVGFFIIKFYFLKIKLKDKKLKNNLFFVSFSLFVLWPSHIIHSARIGNDVMFYLFYLLSLLFLSYWNSNEKKVNLVWFFIFTFLTLISKKNGIVLIAITYSLFGLKFLLDKHKLKNITLHIKTFSIISLIFLLMIIAVFFESFEKRLKGEKHNSLLGSSYLSLNRHLFVDNFAQNYLFFDTKEFLTVPFANPWEDKGGRQYFLNYFAKTALFGEFTYKSIASKNIAIFLSFIFLFMMIYSLIGFFILKKDLYISIAPLIFNFCFLILSVVAFRIIAPASCHTDFRFAFPALISIVIFYAISIFEFHSRGYKKLYYTGYILFILFIIFTILFIFVI